ncbi:MAG: hypothetical protein H8D22_09305 [Candidatus Cloacimonetes bacterium]|nr:hypothetical protein [Candidatus Cloacimonadota bacterium]
MRSVLKYFLLIAIAFLFIILHSNGIPYQKNTLSNTPTKIIDKTEDVPQYISSNNSIEILNQINMNILKILPKSILGIPISILFTILLTLIISLICVYFAYYLSTIKKRKNLIILFKYMISLLIQASKNQSQNFKKIIELLNEKKNYHDYPLGMKCNFNLNLLNRLPLDIIIEKIIKKKTKSEILSNFLTHLNILDTISNIYKVDHEKMVYKFNQYLKSWNYNIDKIREAFDSYVSYFKLQGGYKRGVDTFFDDFDLIYSNLQKQKEYLDYYVTIEYFLDPLHDLCKRNIANITALTLLNHILACKASFNDYLRTKEIYSGICTHYMNKINESSDFLEKNLENVFK